MNELEQAELLSPRLGSFIQKVLGPVSGNQDILKSWGGADSTIGSLNNMRQFAACGNDVWAGFIFFCPEFPEI